MFWYKSKGDSFNNYMNKIIGGIVNCCNSYIRTYINNALPEVDVNTINSNDTNTLLKLILLQLSINQAQNAVMDKANSQILMQIVTSLTPSPEIAEMQKKFFEDFKKRKNDEEEGDWWKRGGKEPA